MIEKIKSKEGIYMNLSIDNLIAIIGIAINIIGIAVAICGIVKHK